MTQFARSTATTSPTTSPTSCSSPIPQTNFQLAFVPQPAQLRWLAVATDGWSAGLLGQLEEPRSALTLQRWLNVQSQQRGQFDDDGAVAIWHEGGNF